MEHIYNIYLTFGTIPSLYSQINLFIDKNPSYVYVRSAGAFKPDKIKHLKHIKDYYRFDWSDYNYIHEQYKVVRDQLIKIKEMDSNSKFVLYIDDSRVQFYIKPFKEANALDDIVSINIISEGNASKFMYYKLKSDDEEFSKKRWQYLIETNNDEDLIKIDNLAYYVSTLKGVRYYLPYFDKFNNPSVKKNYRAKMNLEHLMIEEMYDKLNVSEKNIIFESRSLNINSNQKYLAIIGTLDFGPMEINTGIIENLIDQVLEDYKDEYTFLYKAHPLSRLRENESLLNYLKEKNINIIPNEIPIEVLLWEYKNIEIGGFSSSIVSLIDSSRIKFVFGQNLGYGNIIFDDSNPLKVYNLILSQNVASHILRYYYSIKERIERLENIYTINNQSINEKNLEIDALKEEINLLRQDIYKIKRISLGYIIYSMLRKIKRLFYKMR